MIKSLNQEIQSIKRVQKNTPVPLPLGHITAAKRFMGICRSGQLDPQDCPMLKEKIIYLFYGGLFYKNSRGLSQEDLDLPIAFVFNPKVLTKIALLVPFDSGGALAGKYENWPPPPREVKEYFISNVRYKTAPKLVSQFFGSNKNYLNSEYINDTNLPPYMKDVLALYADDMTGRNVDRRKYSIECIARSSIVISKYLELIAFPKAYMEDFKVLLRRFHPRIPEFIPYECSKVKSPSDICATIANEINNSVLPKYLGEGRARKWI